MDLISKPSWIVFLKIFVLDMIDLDKLISLIKNNYKKIQHGAVGGGTIYVIAIILLLVGFGTVLTNGLVPPDKVPTGAAVTIVPPAPDKEKKNLQLYTFGFTTPVPTLPPQPTSPPAQECTHADDIKSPTCGGPCIDMEVVACEEDPCNEPGSYIGEFYDKTHTCLYNSWVMGDGRWAAPIDEEPYRSEHEAYSKKLSDPKCLQACYGKPVIYLYPEFPMLVDVKLTIPGKVIESDPLYPTEGWKNVLAHPDGSLVYKGENYKELYYESQVDKVNAPDNGIVIESSKLRPKLTEITTKLGLKKSEQNEFLDYWLPRLNKLNSPYILFSVIDQAEKERADHVDIFPKPDTRIEFLAYFKPLKSPQEIKPLNLPTNPPKRIGFTAVEWGGTIDN